MKKNPLAAITARAKQIRRGKPGMLWTAAIKQASAELKKGTRSVSGIKTKKAAAPAKKVVKRTTVKRTTVVKVAGMSGVGMAGVKHCVGEISRLEKLIADLTGKKAAAKGSEKTRIAGEISKARKLKTAVNQQKTAYKRII